MMWFVGRLITGGLATCRMTVLRGKWRAMVGRPLPATDAPAVPRAVANDRTGILGSSGGGSVAGFDGSLVSSGGICLLPLESGSQWHVREEFWRRHMRWGERW